MTAMVQVAVAGGVTEAEEIEALLAEAGIEARLEPAVEHDAATPDDPPTKVLVPEGSLETALEVIEAMSEPDDYGA